MGTIVLASLALIACSSPGGSPDGSGGFDASRNSDAAADSSVLPDADAADLVETGPSDTGVEPEADADGSAEDGGLYANSGQVSVTQGPAGGTHRVHAYFSEGPLYPNRDCTKTTRNRCRFVECGADMPSYDSAGTVTVEAPEQTIQLTPNSVGQYYTEGTTPLWTSPGSVRIRAEGGTIPAFDVRAATHTGATIERPAIPPRGETWEIDDEQALEVRFASEGPDAAVFTLAMVSYDADRTTQMTCMWSTSETRHTVPKAFLQGMVHEEIDYGIHVSTHDTVEVGTLDVEILVNEIAGVADHPDRLAAGKARFR